MNNKIYLITRILYLLTSWKLEFGSSESFNNGGLVFIVGPDGHKRLSDSYTGYGTLWLSKGSTHSGLQTISA